MKNEKLIYHIIKKCGLYDRRDEFIDVGYIGLAKGLKKYKPSFKCKKSTFIYTCVRNEILNEIRKETRNKRKVTIVETDQENIANEEQFEKSFEEIETNNELYKNLFRLPIYEQYIIYQSFFNHKSQKEIAQRLEMTQTKVSQLKANGIEKLKKAYNISE